jgi:hypothetical protein
LGRFFAESFCCFADVYEKESSLSDKILSGWLTLLAIEFLTCGLDYQIYEQPLLSSSFLLFNPAMFCMLVRLPDPTSD